MEKEWDILIVGAGPAGMTAAIYAKRAGLKVLVLEKNGFSGGQILNTYEVDNYPGLPGIGGYELGQAFNDHAEKLGVEVKGEEVLEIINQEKNKKVITDQNEYFCKSIILATGATFAHLYVPGEVELTGKGVSYCATCDGAFYKDKITAVIGGGDVAVEDAIFLTRFCKKVYIILRRDQFRAAKILQDELLNNDKVEIIYNTVVEEICGETHVENIITRNVKDGIQKRIELQGVFIAVGNVPDTKCVEKLCQLDEKGCIIAGEDCRSSIKGIYAAGDVRTKALRQILTAAADGANAVTSILEDRIQKKI